MARVFGFLVLLTGVLVLVSTVYSKWAPYFLVAVGILPPPSRYHYYYVEGRTQTFPSWGYLATGILVLWCGFQLLNIAEAPRARWQSRTAIFMMLLGWGLSVVAFALGALGGRSLGLGGSGVFTMETDSRLGWAFFAENVVAGAALVWIGVRLVRVDVSGRRDDGKADLGVR